MNDDVPLIIIERYQTCSILMLSFISALHHVPLFMDRFWLLLVPVETEVDLHTANKVCGDSTRNEQVKTSVCRINFDGSSANIALFSSRKILVFRKILAKIVNVIQHARSCLSIYWAAICFYSINQPCAVCTILRLINVSTSVTWKLKHLCTLRF